MNKRIDVGVISLGWMGGLHAHSYHALAERYQGLGAEVRLVATYDPVEAARDEAVVVLGLERVYADYHELLADSEVDVVSIRSPNSLHHGIAPVTVATGKPFQIEKPMGVSAVQSHRIVRVADATGLIIAVGLNYRHAPAAERARQLIRDGWIGRVTNVRCWLVADYDNSSERPLIWCHSRNKGGSGVIDDLLSHGAGLTQCLTGRIESVTATSAQLIPERPIPTKVGIGHSGWKTSDGLSPVKNEDWVAILVYLKGGVAAAMKASRVVVGLQAEHVVEVYGTDGSPRWSFEHLDDLFVCAGRDQEFQGYTRTMAGPDLPSLGIFQPGAGTPMDFDDVEIVGAVQFIESVLTGEQLAPSTADGWAAAEIDEAVAVSAADGRWHDVPKVTGRTTRGL